MCFACFCARIDALLGAVGTLSAFETKTVSVDSSDPGSFSFRLYIGTNAWVFFRSVPGDKDYIQVQITGGQSR